MDEQIFLLPAAPPNAVTLDIVFGVNRGLLRRDANGALDIESVRRPSGYSLRPGDNANPEKPNVLVLQVMQGARTGELGIQSLGEGLEFVKFVFRDAHGAALAVFIKPSVSGQTCAEDPDFLEYQPPSAAAAQSFGPGEYMAALDTLLAAAPDTPATKYRKYFAELNRQTNPNLIDALKAQSIPLQGVPADHDTRKGLIDWIISTLGTRVTERARGYAANPCPPLTGVPNTELHYRVRELSTLQLLLIDSLLPKPGCLWNWIPFLGFDHPGFEEAYEMFANGDLRLQLDNLAWTTQPSSGYYFFFAEFALLAIELGIDAGRWRRLSRALIRTQPVFSRVYKPGAGENLVFETYRSCNYDPWSIFTPSEMKGLAPTQPCGTDLERCETTSKNASIYLKDL